MIEYRIDPNIAVEELADLRQSVGWNRLERELSNPNLNNDFTICAYDDKTLVGYIAVLSNNSTDAYIQDLMVHPSKQNQGIGSTLMNMALQKIKEKKIYMISIIYGEERLKTYYEKFGFYTMLCGQIETKNLFMDEEHRK